MGDREARAALSRLSEPGDTRLVALVAQVGAETVYDLLREEQDVAGVYTDVAARLRDLDPVRDLELAAGQGIRLIVPGDGEWPEALGDLDRVEAVLGRGGAPLGLWAKGPRRLGEVCASAVAVVGSRSATTYGAAVAGDLGAHLAAHGTTVVSGAAFGVDQAAHRGALAARGATVAVLACGVDRAYPAAHKSLLDYIADTGLVVSELPPGCAPTRLRFLSRNRIIAALAQGTVVVEAAARSGALSTANWASRLSRVLMGVPGPVTSAPSEGVHQLIRRGEATLVTRGEEVLELVSPLGSRTAQEPRGPERPHDRLGERDRRVLDAVPVRSPAPTASVARLAGVAVAATEESLRRLRGQRLVEESGGRWRLVGPE
ncbi:MAG TPA: DNA-processing protein DprA [Nocardioidaceae bacterium]|nr:DNA-processing protein DprA [Nocardioidaceae bacterium]